MSTTVDVTTEGSVTVDVTTEGDVTVGVEYNPVAGSGTGTNIGITRTASNVVVTSSSGTDGTILAADGTNAGVFTSANFTKLAAITGTNTGDQFIFKNVAVAGQSTVTAETTNDTLTLVAGTNITLTTDATTDSVTITASGGSGDVVGPASSTDNAFARFDSTTGKLLQNSAATLDDNGLASVDGVQFDTTPTSTVGTGKAVWNADNSCLSVGLDTAVVALLGTDAHVKVYNPSASSLSVMQVVRQSGSSGTRLSVQLALADSDVNSATSIGVVAETITTHAEGFIQTAGLLQGVNTMAFNEGDTLWLSASTPGLITSTRPTAPSHGVRIGYCIKKSAGAGIILIDILNGFEIGELHDVLITEPIADNSFLTYDTASSVWINEAPSAAKSSIGLGNVTNNAQTQAAIVPNTAPSAGQILVGNAGGTAYAPVAASGDATLASTGAVTLATVNSNVGSYGSATAAPAVTVNAKGLVTAVSTNTITPAVGSITGLGTGVATALAVNVGTAGAPVVNGGALGTPSSGTLTSCTGLPLSTGVTGDLPLANLAQSSAASKLLGRGSASGAGDFEEITLGTGLSMSGTTISATASGGGSSNVWIPASAWIPKTTAGCGVDSVETTTNDQNFDQLLFDAGTDEFADALVILPNNYNNGTITARFYWTASSGSGDVIWAIQGRAFANDDALDTAAGTAQTVTDTLIAANDMHVTSATSACTIGGTPAANTPIQFTIYRDANAGGDTLAWTLACLASKSSTPRHKMRARHRHLNPASAGAVLALDSRFISGLNDGDAVSTWSDRSSNGYNATASGTARPTFETNEQGGNPTIRFDGVNDTLLTGINSSVIFTGDLTYLIILKRSGSPTFPVAIGFSTGGNNAGRGIFLFSSDLYKLSYGQNAADVKSTFQVSAGTSVLGSAVKEGSTVTVFANSTNVGSGSPATAAVAATNFAIGSGISANFFQGDICFSVAFNSAVQSSLRRRLEHAAAFSFKIACS